MKITIETTPQELAELIFALVDCDVEVEDDEEEEFDTEEDDDAVIRRAKPIYDIDTQLYRKYGLSADEIHFIEHMIQYRVEVLNENYRPYIEDYGD